MSSALFSSEGLLLLYGLCFRLVCCSKINGLEQSMNMQYERISINPNSEWSNHSAGIFSFAKAQDHGKRSSMHGSRPQAGPRTFSRSGKRGTAHHRGLVSLRISDGKFVNHTTEMILWSMILTICYRFCLCNKTKIKLQIGEKFFEPSNEMMHLGWYATWSLNSCSSPCHTIIVQGEPCSKLRAIYRRRGELFTSHAHYLGHWTTRCSFSSAFYKSNDRK